MLDSGDPFPSFPVTIWDGIYSRIPRAARLIPTMRPPILALVIGINEYKCPRHRNLNGAVADANAFEKFLKVGLSVPSTNIISLRDAGASRQAIINGFTALRDNPKYGKDDCAIVIYFAGHGNQVEKPPGWEDWQTPTGKIEILCPSDYDVECADGGGTIQGIPDRTISGLINHMSDIKGNNITLILDCCHSGGLHRKAQDPNLAVRRIDSPSELDPDVDGKIGPIFRTKGPSSVRFISPPVVLAACSRDKVAEERGDPPRGVFTSALLDILENEANLHDLTYLGLIHKLKMSVPRQTPHCEGIGIQWRLFNNQVPGADDCYILTKVNSSSGSSILLHAGAAQGITPGSRFSFHATNLTPTLAYLNEPLGYLVVDSVSDISSKMKRESGFSSSDTNPLQEIFYSKLVQLAGWKTTLFCDDKEWLGSIFPPKTLQELSAEIVEDAESCELQLSLRDDKVYFSHNRLVQPHLGSRNRFSVSVEDAPQIREVVCCWIHFYYHLMRSGPNEFKDVWMELKTLKRDLTDDNEYLLKPVGRNLIEDEPALIVVDENESLGLTIFNKTEYPLYPYVFYFDPSELSIFEWYKPPYGVGLSILATKLKVDVPLPPQKALTLGYGDGGVNPMRFFLPKGQEKDLGFFKLFLCAQPTYFDSIRQKSPFDTEDNTTPLGARGVRSARVELPEGLRWGTHLRTFIQLAKE